jgi:adenylate cyclase
MAMPDSPEQPKLTLWQRLAVREIRRQAGRRGGEPLRSEDWRAAYAASNGGLTRAMHWVWRALPRSPRCCRCGAPFAGPGRLIVSPLGYRPSRKNPTICSTCVETSPPGGMKMYTGVLFADLRGFTALTESADPEDASKLLRRFYRCAEDVLFPEAIIDKLMGDEVMALYCPEVHKGIDRAQVPALMLEHSRELLRSVGYGSGRKPFVEVGIGLDVGEAFVGNIGERALYDFTAIGDVVNTASRLQGQATGGEIVLSDRVEEGLPEGERAGTRIELSLKGKREPQVAYRVKLAESDG